MNEVLKIVVSHSLSGSILALCLWICQLFLKKKLSQTFQYYIWLVVILRFLLPFSYPQSILGTVFSAPPVSVYQSEDLSPEISESEFSAEAFVTAPSVNTQQETVFIPSEKSEEKSFMLTVPQILCWIWLLGAAIRFFYQLGCYLIFIKKLKKESALIVDPEVIAISQKAHKMVGVKRWCPLYSTNLSISPGLFGLLHPAILIHSEKIPKDRLYHILLHELTHQKRKDVLYKWLIQLMCCLHWFNPVCFFMAREIEKECELSCDEKVVELIDNRRSYGDTLLYTLRFHNSNLKNSRKETLFLSRDAKLIKERLDAIMSTKKKTAGMVILTLLITIVLFGSAVTVGAYSGDYKGGSIVSGLKYLTGQKPVLLNEEYKLLYQGTGGQENVTITVEVPEDNALLDIKLSMDEKMTDGEISVYNDKEILFSNSFFYSKINEKDLVLGGGLFADKGIYSISFISRDKNTGGFQIYGKVRKDVSISVPENTESYQEVIDVKKDIPTDEEASRVYDDPALLTGDDLHSVMMFGSRSLKECEYAMVNGSETLWDVTLDQDIALTMDYQIKCKAGQIKVVYIAPDNTVQTIFEGNASGSKELPFKKGRNRIKLVGKDRAVINKMRIDYRKAELEKALYAAADLNQAMTFIHYLDSGSVDPYLKWYLQQNRPIPEEQIRYLYSYASEEIVDQCKEKSRVIEKTNTLSSDYACIGNFNGDDEDQTEKAAAFSLGKKSQTISILLDNRGNKNVLSFFIVPEECRDDFEKEDYLSLIQPYENGYYGNKNPFADNPNLNGKIYLGSRGFFTSAASYNNEFKLSLPKGTYWIYMINEENEEAAFYAKLN